MFVVSWALLFGMHAFAEEFPQSTAYTTPTKQLVISEYPTFEDDKDFVNLQTAIQRQLDKFAAHPPSGTIELGGKTYPIQKAIDSLNKFLELIAEFKTCKTHHALSQCFHAFNTDVQQQFNVFVPKLVQGDIRFGEDKDSFFTSYATQPIKGREKKGVTYKHAIYGKPTTEALRTKTRGEIDFHGALKGNSLELLYTADLFDAYILSVEGAGYVTYTDKAGKISHFWLSYNGTNSQSWKWISAYMLLKGYIANPTLAAQRKYINAHPELAEEIFSTCPSYVYYKITQTPPMGSGGVSVTPGRSMATDHTLYKFKGLLAYVKSERPVETGNYDLTEEDVTKIQFAPFSRFFIDQDTGGAITGKGRADLYMGVDEYAQYMATYQSQTGNLFFLLLK